MFRTLFSGSLLPSEVMRRATEVVEGRIRGLGGFLVLTLLGVTWHLFPPARLLLGAVINGPDPKARFQARQAPFSMVECSAEYEGDVS
jgi:hypothetical protein